jgi:hypothetical protein
LVAVKSTVVVRDVVAVVVVPAFFVVADFVDVVLTDFSLEPAARTVVAFVLLLVFVAAAVDFDGFTDLPAEELTVVLTFTVEPFGADAFIVVPFGMLALGGCGFAVVGFAVVGFAVVGFAVAGFTVGGFAAPPLGACGCAIGGFPPLTGFEGGLAASLAEAASVIASATRIVSRRMVPSMGEGRSQRSCPA